MTVWLVRHGKAGDRRKWQGSDESRPLSRGGQRQALELVDGLSAEQPKRVLSSPATRCVETVAPLADAHDLVVEIVDELAEGSDPADALALLVGLGTDAVACSHGDVILGVLELLARRHVVDSDCPAAKGSTWVLTVDSGEVVGARYHGPTVTTKRR